MAKCVSCGAETALYVGDEPVCVDCDDQRSQPQRCKPSTRDMATEAGCSVCAVLQADYERSVIDLDSAVTETREAWVTSEYDKRERKADKARLDAENARFALDRHRRTHAMYRAASAGGRESGIL